MITVEPFEPWHLAAMAVQPAQREIAEKTPAEREALGRRLTGNAFTIRAAGEVVFCGGGLITHAQHVTLWSAVDKDAGRHLLAIDRRVRAFLRTLTHRRVDTTVRAMHAEGHRWVLRLGFELEAVIHNVFEDGEHMVVYRMMRQ